MELTKSKYLKQHMDPLTSAYLKVIEENASNGKVEGETSTVGAAFGDKKNDHCTHKFISKSGTENVEGEIEKPEEAPAELNSDTSESEAKEVKKGEKLSLKGEAKNPFDALFNRILSEDTFDFSTEQGNELAPNSDFGGPEGLGKVSAEEDEFGFGDEDEDYEHEEDVEHEEIGELVSQLKELVSKLEAKLSEHEETQEEEDESEESEESEDSEDSEEAEDESEELNEEEVEAEVLGHALVDQEKLEAGHTKKAAYTVKGAVPVTKKSAQVVKGKKVTGKPESHSTEGGVSKLTAKSNDVGGVQTGKDLFAQN